MYAHRSFVTLIIFIPVNPAGLLIKITVYKHRRDHKYDGRGVPIYPSPVIKRAVENLTFEFTA